MDTTTLVKEQIDEGQRFLHELKQSGFNVDVACWVLTTYDGLWLLYIASDSVEKDGRVEAFRKVLEVIRRRPQNLISGSDIRVIGKQDPIAVEAAEFQDEHEVKRFLGRKLGKLIIEEAYLYPKQSAKGP